MIKIKRIYELADKEDGFRILVDRLWPRGVSKEKAAIDLWFKDISPSTELRKWFSHDPKKWSSFQKKYKTEISDNKKSFEELKNLIKAKKKVTLLFGAKDETHNEAIVLADILNKI